MYVFTESEVEHKFIYSSKKKNVGLFYIPYKNIYSNIFFICRLAFWPRLIGVC